MNMVFCCYSSYGLKTKREEDENTGGQCSFSINHHCQLSTKVTGLLVLRSKDLLENLSQLKTRKEPPGGNTKDTSAVGTLPAPNM